ncbi:MAG: flippase [Lachnospiraceae bacterium]|nr:flippase [Lachnospiraceae bacterium]
MKQKSIKLNFIMNAILTISGFLFPLITFPYISRVLLPEGTGRVNFAISLINYFIMFAMMGIPTYGIRACAQVRDDKEKLSRTAHELLFINLIMSVLAYILLAGALLFIPRLFEDRLLYLIISASILFTAIGMEWLFKALEEYTYITIRSLVFQAISIIAMFLLVHEKDDYVIYGAISIVAASASNVLNLIHARKYIFLHPVGNYNLKRHFKPVLVFFAMACATTVYTNLDNVMLGFMKGDVDVGYYNAAVKIKTILVAIVTSLGNVLLPRVSYYVQKKQYDEFKRVCRKAINFVFVGAAPLSLYFILYAKNGVYLLSGTAYTGSILPMQIIMPTVLLIGLTGIMGIQVLVPLGKEKIVLYSEIAGAVTDLILNWLLIPHLGAAGAAIGTLVAEFVVFLFQLIVLRKELGDTFKSIKYYKIILAMMAGTAACIWVQFLNLGNFISLLISAVLFFGVYYGVMMLLREELTCDITNQMITWIKSRIMKRA